MYTLTTDYPPFYPQKFSLLRYKGEIFVNICATFQLLTSFGETIGILLTG